MEKLKKAILNKERWAGLNVFIESIELNKEGKPNIALDNSKSLLETISKTILNDKKISFENDLKIGALIKLTFGSLPVFHKISQKDAERGKKIVNALSTIVIGIGEFRNEHGFFSHGQDMQKRNFDNYLVELVVESTDLLASFLIIAHSEDLNNRKRLYYDEYPDFNKWFDDREEWPIVKEIAHSPSKTLFYNDIEFYKEELQAFESDRDILIPILEDAENKEEIMENIINIDTVFSEEQLRSFNKILKQQKDLSDRIQKDLRASGVFKAMEKLNLEIQPMLKNIKKINNQLNQKKEYVKDELRDEIIDEHFDDLRGQYEYEEMRDNR